MFNANCDHIRAKLTDMFDVVYRSADGSSSDQHAKDAVLGCDENTIYAMYTVIKNAVITIDEVEELTADRAVADYKALIRSGDITFDSITDAT